MYKNIVEGKGGISSKVVADSMHNGIRLTTLELRYPRFIHSEFMTHRMFSRNASSSRAIPVEKMIKQVKTDLAMPIHWGKNQPGMQAKEENGWYDEKIGGWFDQPIWGELSPQGMWRDTAYRVVENVNGYNEAGYHKQIVNRLLEPFQFITVVVTATEWDNFFSLRLHPDAQPEIQELARVMRVSVDGIVSKWVPKDTWHLPYVDISDFSDEGDGAIDWDTAIKCSVARCARVSYLNHDNTIPDIQRDVELHDRLFESKHMSPFEHVATPMYQSNELGNVGWWRHERNGITHSDKQLNLWSGNFRGWIQYRQMI